ncbi:3'-5' exonuclease [archaeon]|jgi:DNA polymerase III epsilon subunit-like protein|nr:3'-5' exonuclease [archaeon]
MERLVIDTETTGLSPRFNSLLTVGMLHIDVEKDFLKILDSSHIFIRHLSGSVNPQALKVNKINIEEHNKTAITPNSACKQINQFIDKNSLHKTLLVGHNLHFDRGFLSALYVKEDQDPIFHHEHEDTMYIWRNLQKKGIVPYGRSNLQTLSEHFNLDYSKAHDALADCHITAKVYHKMLNL